MTRPFSLYEPFSDRPTHPDFARLSQVTIELDKAVEGASAKSVPDIIAPLIDEPSLQYMAINRAKMVLAQLDLPPQMLSVISAAWLNAFCCGVRFEQEGGHQESVI